MGRCVALTRLRESRAHRRGVVTVDALYVPAVGLEARGNVLRERQARGPVDRDAVVVVEHDELAEPEVTRERGGFGRNAFHQVAVTRERPGAVVDQLAAEARGEQPLCQRHPDRIAEALPERPGRRLDARSLAVFGVARRARAERAERAQILQREVVAREVKKGVEQHRAVPGRQHEAIPIGPVRHLGVVLQELAPQHRRQLGTAERQSDVADPGLANGVDRQDADRARSAVDGVGGRGGAQLGLLRWSRS